MNRIIKFRAWFDDGKDTHMFFVGDEFGTTHSLDACRYLQQGQPVTLLQFTGLHDVNGVEIYEGDIVFGYDFNDELLFKSEIKFSKGKFYTSVNGWECNKSLGGWDVELEVKGNVYQNNNLLGEDLK